MINLRHFYGKELKKFLVGIGLICLLLLFGGVTAGAAGNAKVTVSSCTVERDASASISFNLENNPGIWGIKLRISYDHSALTLKSASSGVVFEKGEMILSQDLNKDPYVVVASGNSLENKTANGAIVSLNFTVNSDAEFKTYPVTVEVSQANDVDGNKVSIDSVEGGITVVNCTHAEKEWRVTKAAKCEETGVETQICKKCEETFGTRDIKATGHQHTELRNAKAATTKAEGYTGDTYCKDCGKLVKKGTSIAKLESGTTDSKPAETKPAETKPAETKPAEAKPTETKPTETKPAETKPAETKPAETKPAETKPAETKPVETKPADETSNTNTPDSEEPEDTVETETPDSEGTEVTTETETPDSEEPAITTETESTEFSFQEEETESSESKPATVDKQSSIGAVVVVVILVIVLAGGFAAFYIKTRRRG